MLTFLEAAWNFKTSVAELIPSVVNYQFSPLPILVMYLLFDSASILRNFRKQKYVPMYFMIFPTGHSDEQYARYFGDDDFFGDGEKLNAKQRAKLKTKCFWSGVSSMLWAAVFAPWLCGFVAAFFVSAEQFRDFVFFLLFVKAILIYRSLQLLRHESRAVGDNFKYLLGLYLLYLGVTYYGLTASFDYAASSLKIHGVAGMPIAFLRDAYKEFFVNVVVVSLAWTLFARRFLGSHDD